MLKKPMFIFVILFSVAAVAGLVYVANNSNMGVLDPKGIVAAEQLNLLIFATLLMLIVVVPVFILTIFIALKYRETNKNAKYTPDWDHHRGLEAIWWGIPCAIILVLAIVTWQSSHQLDPYRPLESEEKPLAVQVVALQWKWLFIYPEQQIATVNYLNIPEDVPVNFEITADAPMNSFWIPQLGGQVYAMNGMETKLHLMADEPGTYQGVSSNISGEGFADMRFSVNATSKSEFDEWISSIKQLSPEQLDDTSYSDLAKPGSLDAPKSYGSIVAGLHDKIMHKYMDMEPANGEEQKTQHHHEG